MKKFLHKNRELLALLLWLLLIFVGVRFVVTPLLEKISNTNDQIQEASLRQEITKRNISNLPNMQKQFEQIQDSNQFLDVLLDKNAAIELIKKLEQSADDTGVKIAISVQDKPVQKTQPVVKNKTTDDNLLINNLPSSNYLELKLALTGTYAQIMNFIDTVEHFDYYGDIISLDIKKDDTSKDNAASENIGVVGVQSPGSVSADPFSDKNVSLNNKANDKQVDANNDLTATIDMVFYTK